MGAMDIDGVRVFKTDYSIQIRTREVLAFLFSKSNSKEKESILD